MRNFLDQLDANGELVKIEEKVSSYLEAGVLGAAANSRGSGYVCPECGRKVDIMQHGGDAKLSQEFGVPLLAKLPMLPEMGACSDRGRPYICDHPSSALGREAFKAVDIILSQLGG